MISQGQPYPLQPPQHLTERAIRHTVSWRGAGEDRLRKVQSSGAVEHQHYGEGVISPSLLLTADHGGVVQNGRVHIGDPLQVLVGAKLLDDAGGPVDLNRSHDRTRIT